MADTTRGGTETARDPILELQSGADNPGAKDGQHVNETTSVASEEQQDNHPVLQAKETLKPEKAKPELVQTTVMAEGISKTNTKDQTSLAVEHGQRKAIDLTEDSIASGVIDFTIDSPSISSHGHIESVQPHRAMSIKTLINALNGDGEIQAVPACASKPNTGDNNQRDKSGNKDSSLPIRSSISHIGQEIHAVDERVGYALDEVLVESEDRKREIKAHEARVALLKWKMARFKEQQMPAAELPGSLTNESKVSTALNQPDSNRRLESMRVAQHIPGMVAPSGHTNVASYNLNRPFADTKSQLAPLNMQPVSNQATNEPMVRPMEPSFHQDIFSRSTQKQQTIIQSPQSAYSHGYVVKSSVSAQPQMHGMQQVDKLSLWKSRRLHRKPAQIIDEHDCGDESDDDEPLITRTNRHPSITKASGSGSKMSMEKGKAVMTDQDDSDVEWVKSNRKGAALASKNPTNAIDQSSTANAAQSATQGDPPDDGLFDWKIPKYEVLYEAPASKDEPAIARVSIPGAPRENMFLSPDHEQQEMELLLNIFLPGQQKLEKPDPEPAHAILNFHTIAVMVIEAYKQFEIGDEFGTGRGHWHNDHDQGDEEYERLRDARDADPDEIFFSVVDRWRTGLEVKKQPCQMIRGAQEFCDTALDIIYYFKENGLAVEPKRKNRSDKGTKRGPKATGSNTAGLEQSGSKRAGATEVNEVQARKKVKTDTKAKAPYKKKSDAGVSVVRTPKK